VTKITTTLFIRSYEPYYKSKLEMKSNLSEILAVNCKFIYDSTPTYGN